MTKQITISSKALALQVSDIDSPSLDPSDCKHYPIVFLSGDCVEIIDGFHRIAGMIKFGAVEITCVTTDNLDLLGDAANHEDTTRQAKAIREIYAAM